MSLAHKSPIVDHIVFNLIRSVHFKEFKFSHKETIDSSIVPAISESTFSRRGFSESSFPSQPKHSLKIPAFLPPGKHLEKPIVPLPRKEPQSLGPPGFQESIIEKDKPLQPKPLSPNTNPSINNAPKQPQQIRNIPPKIQIVPTNLFQNPPNYGKLNNIIRDPAVFYMDCPGPNKKILVTTRNGQKQQTNVMMNKEEIKMLLDNISAKTKIPLIQGVFRVSWDNFIINAIISDTIEPRFVMQKIR